MSFMLLLHRKWKAKCACRHKRKPWPYQSKQDRMPQDTISSFVLTVDRPCEKALITPKSTVFLPSISTASEGFPYLTLLHYNMKKQVVILLAAKGEHFSPFLLYTPGLTLQPQRIYSSLYKLLYQLRNCNSCQTPSEAWDLCPIPARAEMRQGRGEVNYVETSAGEGVDGVTRTHTAEASRTQPDKRWQVLM